jgi:hypothetical protein
VDARTLAAQCLDQGDSREQQADHWKSLVHTLKTGTLLADVPPVPSVDMDMLREILMIALLIELSLAPRMDMDKLNEPMVAGVGLGHNIVRTMLLAVDSVHYTAVTSELGFAVVAQR